MGNADADTVTAPAATSGGAGFSRPYRLVMTGLAHAPEKATAAASASRARRFVIPGIVINPPVV
jgi:hypothetical protein